jgi:hypothetical protein
MDYNPHIIYICIGEYGRLLNKLIYNFEYSSMAQCEDDMGLRYRGANHTHFKFEITDERKYFMARLKHGI